MGTLAVYSKSFFHLHHIYNFITPPEIKKNLSPSMKTAPREFTHVDVVAMYPLAWGHGEFENLLTPTEWVKVHARQKFLQLSVTLKLRGTYLIITSPWPVSIGRFARCVIQRNDPWQR